METIRGKLSLEIDMNELQTRLAGYENILLDLGTGDGRFVRWMAENHPDRFVIGLDACRENLREHSQVKLPNALFVIANAQALPRELCGIAAQISINFPWGSLLDGLLNNDPALMRGLADVAAANATIAVHLNGGALAEAGRTLEAGADRIYGVLRGAGWRVRTPSLMDARNLRNFPSTWARRLAFGRDPRALALQGRLAVKMQQVENVFAFA